MSSVPSLNFQGRLGFLAIGVCKSAADVSGGDNAVFEHAPNENYMIGFVRNDNFIDFNSESLSVPFRLNTLNENGSIFKLGVLTIYTDIKRHFYPDDRSRQVLTLDGTQYSYKSEVKVYPGQFQLWTVPGRCRCLVSFRERLASTQLTVVNSLNSINYSVDKILLDAELTTVKELKDTLLARHNGGQVMAAEGLRRPVDGKKQSHYLYLDAMVFSTAYTSAGLPEFTGNQQSYFATDCAVAVNPAIRPGWENTNRKKFDMSKITELADDDKFLAEYNVGDHGFLIVRWRYGPDDQQGIDWADAGIDILFSWLGTKL